MMRSTVFRLALLGAAFSMPALAQVSPATPDRNPPAAAVRDSTQPGTPAPTPNAASGANAPGGAAPADRSGANVPNRNAEGGQRAVTTDSGTRTANAPVPGANSFTEGQARSRIEAAGFSGVSDLQKDDQGIWRGKAMHNGQQVSVALDYQGNVSTQ